MCSKSVLWNMTHSNNERTLNVNPRKTSKLMLNWCCWVWCFLSGWKRHHCSHFPLLVSLSHNIYLFVLLRCVFAFRVLRTKVFVGLSSFRTWTLVKITNKTIMQIEFLSSGSENLYAIIGCTPIIRVRLKLSKKKEEE